MEEASSSVSAFAGLLVFLYITNNINRLFELILIFIILTIVDIIMEFIRWHRFSYTIENGHLQIQSGLFNRQHRTIPLDRIQQVDIIQDGLSSVFGLAIVRCETAGTKVESEIELRYVGKDQANSIRKRLGETTSTATANSDPTVLYQASPRSLALRSLTTLHSKYVLLGLVTIVIGLSELLSSSLDRISVPSVMVGGPVIIADGILVVGIILVIACLRCRRSSPSRPPRGQDPPQARPLSRRRPRRPNALVKSLRPDVPVDSG